MITNRPYHGKQLHLKRIYFDIDFFSSVFNLSIYPSISGPKSGTFLPWRRAHPRGEQSGDPTAVAGLQYFCHDFDEPVSRAAVRKTGGANLAVSAKEVSFPARTLQMWRCAKNQHLSAASWVGLTQVVRFAWCL